MARVRIAAIAAARWLIWAASAVEDLRQQISCIQSISVGENFTDRSVCASICPLLARRGALGRWWRDPAHSPSHVPATRSGKGFTHALIVRLPDRESLEVYRDHPAHKQVLEEIIPAKEDVLAIDMDCARKPGPYGRNEDIGRVAIASIAGAALGFVAAAVFRRMTA